MLDAKAKGPPETSGPLYLSPDESLDMESYLSIDFRYSFNAMQVNHMPPPVKATIVPPATNRNKIAPKFESMLSIELSFRPLVKGRATVERHPLAESGCTITICICATGTRVRATPQRISSALS